MRKLTYLVASLLVAVTAGTTFTGCINSDEPAGIEHLRDAKAALLKSKQALIEAQAAKALAEAEAIKVEAAANAAKIDAERAKTEAEIEEIRQRTANAMLQAQAQLEILQQQLENLKLAYAQEKMNLSEQMKTYIDYYYTQYFQALEDYNTKYVAWLKAQKQLVEDALDPDGTEYDKKVQYEEAVATAEKNLADANQELSDLTDSLAVVKTWKPTELGAKLTQYKEEVEANNELLAMAQLKKAETENESEEGKKYQALVEEVNKVSEEWIAIPAYTFNANGEITIPGLEEPREVVTEGRFSLTSANAYWNTSAIVNSFKSQISNYVLNENGEAWTQADINALTRQKAEKEEVYTADLDRWQMFVNAFNKGAEPKYSALEGYDAIDEAVVAYNKTLAPVATAKTALIAAEAAYNEAAKAAGNRAADKAVAEKDAADEAARVAYETALAAAQDEYTATMAKLDEAVKKAQVNATEAAEKRIAAKKLFDATPDGDAQKDALKKAFDDAVAAEEAADKAVEAAVKARDEQSAVAAATMAKAVAVAEAAQKVANAEAQKAFALAIMEATKSDTALDKALQAAWDKFFEEQDAFYAEAGKAVVALQAVLDAVAEQTATIGGTNVGTSLLWDYYYSAFIPGTQYWPAVEEGANEEAVEGRKAFEAPIPEITVAEVCAYQTDELKRNVIETSHVLYGFAWTPAATESAYLVAPTKEEIIDHIKEVYGGNPSAGTIQNELEYYYGSFGQVLAYENRIEVAQAYISNKAAMDAAFAEIDTYIENLEKSYDDQNEKCGKVYADQQKAWQAVQDLNAEVNAQIRVLNSKNNVAGAMIRAIEAAAQATGVDQEDNYTQETIDEVIANVEQAIEDGEKAIPDLEKALDRAKYILEQYEKGLLSNADMAQIDVEEAKLALDAAKAKLDAAKERLDAANKRLEEVTA